MSLRLIEMISENPVDISEQDFEKNIKIVQFWSETFKDGLYVFKVLTQTQNTELILDIFEKKWGDNEAFRVVIYKIEATFPLPKEEEKEKNEDNKRIACIELVQNLSSQSSFDKIYFLTVFLSTIVASIGLIHGNIPVVIGAMVIAPFLSSNMLLSLATTLGDIKLAKKAIAVLVSGLAVSLIVSVLIGLLLPFDHKAYDIMSRTRVQLTDIILALAAGSAGALAFTSGLPASLVGVMVAVSLLPPLVVAGLFLGNTEWIFALRAFLLLFTNIICINISGIVTFLSQGIRPHYWWEEKRAKKMISISISVWLFLLILLLILIYTLK